MKVIQSEDFFRTLAIKLRRGKRIRNHLLVFDDHEGEVNRFFIPSASFGSPSAFDFDGLILEEDLCSGAVVFCGGVPLMKLEPNDFFGQCRVGFSRRHLKIEFDSRKAGLKFWIVGCNLGCT